ncbi:MAG TPA: L-serine ammonia-lyase, iron-sulfur-dependent, subunit alpha [Candidatus Blautia avistercoris]|uniref:L-serine ammonia-lyase, iron-sulfur-dependent, subunit alpha n=1 Tax=Blautia sp. An249 TaxID=1965603 RepID=UPI000B37414F|nr:L-serine ammonia-lyase, iron-sulfur-dependent, subunit alpha [Blautia sp. An249]OUO76597.1 L-serine ammonia-lyase, iron-sulfur-dependent, subunit alpha [Blautia sp. An249]HIY18383.1 L-serine ammonia-lyase, iron-sulfur-dependent, subunit alpha [Candidatus Blautia avistercoris]
MYTDIEQLLKDAEERNLPLHKIILENEMELNDQTEEEIYDRLRAHWSVMEDSSGRALEQPLQMQPPLIRGQSSRQYTFSKKEGSLLGEGLNEMMAAALSASEQNASMGKICAAPTAGACGILPAVIGYAARKKQAEEKEILDALLVTAGFGTIITKNATVSGAEGGCQAECGVAAAISAAGCVYLYGGTKEQCASALAIALINCMGLICDPVAGLVQVPCSFRNASQSMNALLSADLALAGQDSIIPADQVIEAMYRVGKRLPSDFRETAMGGIAASPEGLAIAAEFNRL